MSNKSFIIQYVIKARDGYSSIANKVAAATRKIETHLERAKRRALAFSDSMKKISKSMLGISSITSATATAASALSIKNFDKQAVAIAKVRNSIRSTGGAAGLTLKQLTAEASRLQGNTLFGDEDILNNATAQLLTFTNIAGDNFKRTQAIALDLATMLDSDLKSASIQLGKALNDPVANLSALSRSGIQFTKQQQQLIKYLAENGRLADAQSVILKELEKQYGGTARAAAKSGAGPIKQLMNLLGDATEDIGKIQVQMLAPIIEFGKKAANAFMNLSPPIKKFIAGGLLVAVTLAPIVLGIGAIGAAIPAVIAGFTALKIAMTFALGPIGLAIAAIATAATLIITNWGTVKGWFASFWEWIQGIFSSLADVLLAPFKQIMAMKDMVASFLGFGEDKKIESTQKKITEATMNSRSKVDVSMRIGLDRGLKQTAEPMIETMGARRADVGMAGA